MTIKNKNSQIVHTVDEVLGLLLKGDTQGDIVVSDCDEIEKFNVYKENLSSKINLVEEDLSDDFHERKTQTWFIPEQYYDIDLDNFLLSKCNTVQEKNRVKLELEEFKKRNLETVLRLMIFLVDHFKENGVVWGVGRGSSTASYCLYLIGINRVNSLQYDLDIKEFFK